MQTGSNFLIHLEILSPLSLIFQHAFFIDISTCIFHQRLNLEFVKEGVANSPKLLFTFVDSHMYSFLTCGRKIWCLIPGELA